MSARYLDMLTYYIIPELLRQNVLPEVSWMQVGAPPNIGSSVNVSKVKSLMTGLSPVISRFRGHQGLLISHQWISGSGICKIQRLSISSTNYI